MTLKEKIAARLKAKAAGEKANLSQKRIDAIILRAEKGLTDESDDTQIDANLDAINELTPFKEMASLDDHQRAKESKTAQEKEAARLKAIEEGKVIIEDDPNESSTDKLLKALMAKIEKQDQAIAAIGSEKVATTRREQYAKTLEGTSEVFKAKALKDFDRMAFKDDEDFTSYLADATEDAKAFVQEEANQGLGNDRPNGGVGGSNSSTKKEATEAEVEAALGNIKI